jgi:nitrite reductase (NADH) small subunit
MSAAIETASTSTATRARHGAPRRRVDVGPLDGIPLGQGRAYIAGPLTIAVFRQRDGRVFAADNACPHRGGPLSEGVLGGGKVICPLHAWKIDLETGRCAGEDACVRLYEVEIIDGRVIVILPEVA